MFSHFSNPSFRKFVAFIVISTTLSLTQAEVTPAAAPTSDPESSFIPASVQTLLDNYRRILSLHAYSSSAASTALQQQQAMRIGEYLFVEDQRLASAVEERLLKRGGTAQTAIDQFLAALSGPNPGPALKDADLFAVRPILTEVAKKAVLTPPQARQVRSLLATLAAAHHKYGLELSGALSQKTMTKAERPAWTAYVAGIEQQFPPAAILEEFTTAIPTAAQQATPSGKTEDIVTLARQNEWLGAQLEKGSVLLTFDDGPHPVYTQEILAILARYRVKAIFFQLGQNLGTVTDGHAELTRNEDVEKQILAAGHAIGNHSFTHPFLPKLDQAQVEQEIDKTQALLNLVIPEDDHRTHMFRAPYGARNSMILGEVGERGLRSVLWNVDSLDWSDPIPESIVHRILTELDHAGRGIILMHDIHPKTVIALPMLLDELIKRGYTFMQWDGTGLAATDRNTPLAAPTMVLLNSASPQTPSTPSEASSSAGQ